MSKAEDEALEHSFKYGSGPFVHNQGYAPLGTDPYGIYPAVEDPTPKSAKSAEPATKKES
jgi:hypothetical protein